MTESIKDYGKDEEEGGRGKRNSQRGVLPNLRVRFLLSFFLSVKDGV
jgi:hypothetical protein